MSSKLTITYLDFDDYKNPLLGAGQAHATLEVGKRLVKRGHKVISLCSRYPGYKDRIDRGIYYKHIGLGTKFIRLNNLFYFLAIPFALKDLKSDVIIECFTAPFSVLLSPLFTRTPVAVLPSMFNAKEFSKKYHLPFHFIETLGLKVYKYIMPYSHIDKKKALALNPLLQYKIIPQGVSEKYLNINPKKPKHILFLSRFDIAQKGIDLLLYSYSKVKEKINYPLVIAGHGPDEEKIRNLINRLNLTKKVKIVGSAYGTKKQKLMSEALFVVFPSRHDEMCLWVLEAIAAGLPIVCFDIPESSWIKKEVAIKAKPFNTSQFASKLVLATDLKVLINLRNNCKKFARRYSWENVVTETEKFLQAIYTKEVKIS